MLITDFVLVLDFVNFLWAVYTMCVFHGMLSITPYLKKLTSNSLVRLPFYEYSFSCHTHYSDVWGRKMQLRIGHLYVITGCRAECQWEDGHLIHTSYAIKLFERTVSVPHLHEQFHPEYIDLTVKSAVISREIWPAILNDVIWPNSLIRNYRWHFVENVTVL